MKRRFPALAVGLKVNLQTAVNVIVACCILHNICIDEREDTPPHEIDVNYLDAQIENGQIDHNYYSQNDRREDRRAVITCNFFS